MISIIIPILNESKNLNQQSFAFRQLATKAELIFIDGGSQDSSRDIAAKLGRVITSPKGRSVQMNAGAKAASGDILLFLHADSMIKPEVLVAVERLMSDKRIAGGCLDQRIDSPRRIFRFIEGFGNLRSRLTGVYYGDQAIFVRKAVFEAMGGFPEVPVMEDVLFTKKLRRQGRTVVLPLAVLVSARRWEKMGIIRTCLFYSWLNILFWTGVPLTKIRAIYDDLR
jgi:rSAM/selenodomain-associated transferase 2